MNRSQSTAPLPLRLFLCFTAFITFSVYSVYQASADSDGWIGRSKTGCGGTDCHASSSSSSTSVSIGTQSTKIVAGQTYNFTLTVSNSSSLTAGCNISAQKGTLGRVLGGGGLVLANKELTHSSPMEMSGSATFRFTYKAPSTPGTDVISAVGLGTNGNLVGDASDRWRLASYSVTVVGSSAVETAGGSEPLTAIAAMSNPASQTTKVKISSERNLRALLVLSDMAGRKVLEKDLGMINAGITTVPIDVRMFPNGEYLVTCVMDGEKSLPAKLLVKH